MSHPPKTPPPPPRPKIPPPPPTRPKKGAADRLYSVIQVADLLGCSRQHVYDLIACGELAKTDIGIGGAQTRVPATTLVEFVDRRTTTPQTRSAPRQGQRAQRQPMPPG